MKMSHWMWFILPQVEGLGRTEIAKRYAIKSLDETKAYVSQGCHSSSVFSLSEQNTVSLPRAEAITSRGSVNISSIVSGCCLQLWVARANVIVDIDPITARKAVLSTPAITHMKTSLAVDVL